MRKVWNRLGEWYRDPFFPIYAIIVLWGIANLSIIWGFWFVMRMVLRDLKGVI